MSIPFALIQVFDRPQEGLRGNVAAVCACDSLPSDAAMQALANDLRQPATTFLAPDKKAGHFLVRWFAPDAEIGLCGHGAAAALVYLNHYEKIEAPKLHHRHGVIKGHIEEEQIRLFLDPIEVIEHRREAPNGLEAALGLEVLDYFGTANKDLVLVATEKELAQAQPDFQALASLEPFGYAVTAPGLHSDFVSRTFVPKVWQKEDFATGSSHAALFPFWAERLSKSKMTARQLSSRGGYFEGQITLSKILLKGSYCLLAKGNLISPEFG